MKNNAILLVCVGVFAVIEFVHAVESPIDVEEVARAFDVPVSGIQKTLKTDEVVSKFGDSVQSASLFKFEAAPNAFMQVVITKGHFLLTDGLRDKLEAEPALIEKVGLENGIIFVGTEGVGPGAEGYVAVGHLPSQNVDFRLRVIISNDGATASSGTPSNTFRSSTLLKGALRKLAIASSARLSMASGSLPLTDKGRQVVETPKIQSRNVLHSDDEARGPSRQCVSSERKDVRLPLILLIPLFLFVLIIVFRWIKQLTNHTED